MDADKLKQHIDEIKTTLSTCKTVGEVILFSVIVDTKLISMGEDGTQVAEAVGPLFSSVMKRFNEDPNKKSFHSIREGRA